MQTILIGENCASVQVTEKELSRRGIVFGDFRDQDIRKVLKDAAIPDTWNDVEVEVFPGKEEMLLFVRCETPWRWYSFANFELLLGAAAELRETVKSMLCVLDGTYILGISGNGKYIAEEFGVSVPAGKGYEASLREHGKVLAAENAVCVLQKTFLTSACKVEKM